LILPRGTYETFVKLRAPRGIRGEEFLRHPRAQRSAKPFGQRYGKALLGTAKRLIQPPRQRVPEDALAGANLADVRVARISQKVAELGWEKGVSDAITSVLGDYIDMLYAQADLRVKQDAIGADEKLVEQNQR